MAASQTLRDVKNDIARRSASLRPCSKRFLAYALENPHDIAFGTLSHVARRAGVSANTVINTLRLFEIDDFRSLRDLFRNEIRLPALGRGQAIRR